MSVLYTLIVSVLYGFDLAIFIGPNWNPNYRARRRIDQRARRKDTGIRHSLELQGMVVIVGGFIVGTLLLTIIHNPTPLFLLFGGLKSDLQEIKGVGPKTASKITDFVEAGKYEDKNSLLSIPNIGRKTIQNIDETIIEQYLNKGGENMRDITRLKASSERYIVKVVTKMMKDAYRTKEHAIEANSITNKLFDVFVITDQPIDRTAIPVKLGSHFTNRDNDVFCKRIFISGIDPEFAPNDAEIKERNGFEFAHWNNLLELKTGKNKLMKRIRRAFGMRKDESILGRRVDKNTIRARGRMLKIKFLNPNRKCASLIIDGVKKFVIGNKMFEAQSWEFDAEMNENFIDVAKREAGIKILKVFSELDLVDGVIPISPRFAKMLGIEPKLGAGAHITITTDEGQIKGKAVVIPWLNVDIVSYQVEKEIKLKDVVAIDVTQHIHSDPFAKLDIQSIINFFLTPEGIERIGEIAIHNINKLKKKVNKETLVEFGKKAENWNRYWNIAKSIGMDPKRWPYLMSNIFNKLQSIAKDNMKLNVHTPGIAAYITIDPHVICSDGTLNLEKTVLKPDEIGNPLLDNAMAFIFRTPNCKGEGSTVLTTKIEDVHDAIFIAHPFNIVDILDRAGGGDQDDRMVVITDADLVEIADMENEPIVDEEYHPEINKMEIPGKTPFEFLNNFLDIPEPISIGEFINTQEAFVVINKILKAKAKELFEFVPYDDADEIMRRILSVSNSDIVDAHNNHKRSLEVEELLETAQNILEEMEITLPEFFVHGRYLSETNKNDSGKSPSFLSERFPNIEVNASMNNSVDKMLSKFWLEIHDLIGVIGDFIIECADIPEWAHCKFTDDNPFVNANDEFQNPRNDQYIKLKGCTHGLYGELWSVWKEYDNDEESLDELMERVRSWKTFKRARKDGLLLKCFQTITEWVYFQNNTLDPDELDKDENGHVPRMADGIMAIAFRLLKIHVNDKNDNSPDDPQDNPEETNNEEGDESTNSESQDKRGEPDKRRLSSSSQVEFLKNLKKKKIKFNDVTFRRKSAVSDHKAILVQNPKKASRPHQKLHNTKGYQVFWLFTDESRNSKPHKINGKDMWYHKLLILHDDQVVELTLKQYNNIKDVGMLKAVVDNKTSQ